MVQIFSLDKILVLQSFKTAKKRGREKISLNQHAYYYMYLLHQNHIKKGEGGARPKINNVSTTQCICFIKIISRAINFMYKTFSSTFVSIEQNSSIQQKTYSYMYDCFVQINHYPIKPYVSTFHIHTFCTCSNDNYKQ